MKYSPGKNIVCLNILLPENTEKPIFLFKNVNDNTGIKIKKLVGMHNEYYMYVVDCNQNLRPGDKLYFKKEKMSSIEKQVIEDIKIRAEIGFKKYGTTMDRDDLSLIDWLRHAYEESLDKSIYLMKAIKELENDTSTKT